MREPEMFPTPFRRRIGDALEKAYNAEGLAFQKLPELNRRHKFHWVLPCEDRCFMSYFQFRYSGIRIYLTLSQSPWRHTDALDSFRESRVWYSSVPWSLFRDLRRLDPPDLDRPIGDKWWVWALSPDYYRDTAFLFTEAQVDLYIDRYLPVWASQAKRYITRAAKEEGFSCNLGSQSSAMAATESE